MQDADQIDVFEALSHAAHIKDAEQEQDSRADDNAFDGGGPSRPLNHSADGKHDRDTNDENEEGINQVVKVEAGPFAVVHLRGQSSGRSRIMNLGKRADNQIAADDPEHVEPAQSINREQTGAGSR